MEAVNNDLRGIFGGRSFMSAMCVALDPKSAQATVVGAGHPPLLITRFGRGTEAIPSSAPPLGLVDQSQFAETTLDLNPGDAFTLYTDGLFGAAKNGRARSTLRYARRRGVFVAAAAGNEAHGAIAYPARAPNVVAVGATTEHGCLADYSNDGSGLTLVAPGGGADADLPGDPNCHPEAPAGRDIFQVTFAGSSPRVFGDLAARLGQSRLKRNGLA